MRMLMIFILLMLRIVILSQLETKHNLDPMYNKMLYRSSNKNCSWLNNYAPTIPTELGGEYKHIRSKRVITPRVLDHLKGSS